MNRTSILLLSLVFFSFGSLNAQSQQSVSFKDVWRQVKKDSKAIKSVELDLASVDQAESRSRMHWLPKVYVGAQVYSTNDPGASFFGILEQRSITNTDFNPQTLNNPGVNQFGQVTLGLDMPIYQGGMKAAQRELQRDLTKSKTLQVKDTMNRQYAVVAHSYGSINVLLVQKQKVVGLASDIEKIIKGYGVGNKNNPVGYSGLLGLKSVSNRVKALLVQYEQQSLGYYGALQAMGVHFKTQWKPHRESVQNYIARVLPVKGSESSFQIQALNANAKVAEKSSDMELARYRPHLGLFAQGYHFSGSRDSADGYTAGVYLKWSLFNPEDLGRHSEALLKSQVAHNYALAMAEEEKAKFQGVSAALSALKSNHKILLKSQALLDEQTNVAKKLFKNGSLNALQLSEVLNRRVDLIMSLTEIELNLLKYSSEQILNEKFEVPTLVKGS